MCGRMSACFFNGITRFGNNASSEILRPSFFFAHHVGCRRNAAFRSAPLPFPFPVPLDEKSEYN